MTRMASVRPLTIVEEGVAMAFTNPLATTVTGLLVAAVCATTLLTAGQTSAAESATLSQIDLAGTRTIVVTDSSGSAGLTTRSLDRIKQISGVEWAVGLGKIIDARSFAVGDAGPAVPIRPIYGEAPFLTQVIGRSPARGQVILGPEGLQMLGLAYPSGPLVSAGGPMVAIGEFRASPPMEYLEEGGLTRAEEGTPLTKVTVVALNPSYVGQLTKAVLAVLGVEDSRSLTVETSEVLANVRLAVAGELGSYSRSIVLLVAAAGMVLVAITVMGSVTAHRRDFGRRRALGSSRSTIVVLVLIQSLTGALAGSIVGTGVSVAVVHRLVGGAPDPTFIAAVALLSVISAALGALWPALTAAFRDPVRVLRVP